MFLFTKIKKMKTKKDAKNNIYIEIENVRISYIKQENRKKSKNWTNKDVIRIQALRSDNGSKSLHRGAEFPLYDDNSILKFIEAIKILQENNSSKKLPTITRVSLRAEHEQ